MRAGPPGHQRADCIAQIHFLPHAQAFAGPGVPERMLPLAIEDDDTAVGAGHLGVDDLTGDGREHGCARRRDNIDTGVEVVAAVQRAPAKITAQLGRHLVCQQGNFVVPRLLYERTGQLTRTLVWVIRHIFGKRFSAPLHLDLERLAHSKITRCTVAPTEPAEV